MPNFPTAASGRPIVFLRNAPQHLIGLETLPPYGDQRPPRKPHLSTVMVWATAGFGGDGFGGPVLATETYAPTGELATTFEAIAVFRRAVLGLPAE